MGQIVLFYPSLMDLNIREATADDGEKAADVFDKAFAPLRSIYRPTRDALAHQAERADEGTRLVAEVDGRIVGTAQLTVHEEHVHVIGLAVHPNFQRTGIGKRMLEWIVGRTPSLGRSAVVVDTIRETGNVSVFEKLGFHVVAEKVATWCISDDYPEVHDVKMERRDLQQEVHS